MPGREDLLADLRRSFPDRRIVEAIGAVPRDAFVPLALQARAWEDCALPIEEGQSISQPRVVARMCALLDLAPGARVLDVGTGSGYHAAVLAALGARVWSIERHEFLARRAAATLRRLGVTGVEVLVGDGTRGLPSLAPFDGINVAAAAETADELAALQAQLAVEGVLVAPVGTVDQRLLTVRRTASAWLVREADPVRFVPLVPDFPRVSGVIRRRAR